MYDTISYVERAIQHATRDTLSAYTGGMTEFIKAGVRDIIAANFECNIQYDESLSTKGEVRLTATKRTKAFLEHLKHNLANDKLGFLTYRGYKRGKQNDPA